MSKKESKLNIKKIAGGTAIVGAAVIAAAVLAQKSNILPVMTQPDTKVNYNVSTQLPSTNMLNAPNISEYGDGLYLTPQQVANMTSNGAYTFKDAAGNEITLYGDGELNSSNTVQNDIGVYPIGSFIPLSETKPLTTDAYQNIANTFTSPNTINWQTIMANPEAYGITFNAFGQPVIPDEIAQYLGRIGGLGFLGPGVLSGQESLAEANAEYGMTTMGMVSGLGKEAARYNVPFQTWFANEIEPYFNEHYDEIAPRLKDYKLNELTELYKIWGQNPYVDMEKLYVAREVTRHKYGNATINCDGTVSGSYATGNDGVPMKILNYNVDANTGQQITGEILVNSTNIDYVADALITGSGKGGGMGQTGFGREFLNEAVYMASGLDPNSCTAKDFQAYLDSAQPGGSNYNALKKALKQIINNEVVDVGNNISQATMNKYGIKSVDTLRGMHPTYEPTSFDASTFTWSPYRIFYDPKTQTYSKVGGDIGTPEAMGSGDMWNEALGYIPYDKSTKTEKALGYDYNSAVVEDMYNKGQYEAAKAYINASYTITPEIRDIAKDMINKGTVAGNINNQEDVDKISRQVAQAIAFGGAVYHPGAKNGEWSYSYLDKEKGGWQHTFVTTEQTKPTVSSSGVIYTQGSIDYTEAKVGDTVYGAGGEFVGWVTNVGSGEVTVCDDPSLQISPPAP